MEQTETRNVVNVYSPNRKMETTPYMTKYEKARILGARALQISMGAHVLVPITDQTDSLNIAQMELEAKRIPISIQRKLPDQSIDEFPCSILILDSEEVEDDFTLAVPKTPIMSTEQEQ